MSSSNEMISRGREVISRFDRRKGTFERISVTVCKELGGEKRDEWTGGERTMPESGSLVLEGVTPGALVAWVWGSDGLLRCAGGDGHRSLTLSVPMCGL